MAEAEFPDGRTEKILTENLESIEPRGLKRQPRNRIAAMAGVLGIGALSAFLSLACGEQNAGDIRVFAQPPTQTPTATATIEGLPSQTPIHESRTQPPALTPVETQTSAIPTPTSTPEQTQVTTERQTSSQHDRLREKVNQSSLDTTLKQESNIAIDQFEKADQVLQRFINAYEAEKEPDGTPALMKLIKQRFHNLDLGPYWQDRYPSEQDFWESQIFFLADKEYLDKIITKVLTPEITPREAHDILNLHYHPDGKVIDPQLDRYLQVSSKQITEVKFSPSAEIDEQITKMVQESLNKFPFIGLVEVRINSQKSLDTIGGNMDVKNDIVLIDLSSYKLGNNPDLWEYATLHEAAHSLYYNPDSNLNFYSRERLLHYLTPEQFVRLYLAQEKAMADEEVGRNYPDISKLFQVDRKRTDRHGEKKPYEIKGFSQTSSLFADAIILGQTQEWYGPLKAPIFGKELLPDELTNQFVAEYKARGEEKAALSARIPLTPAESRWLKDHTFVNLSEFLETEKDKLDQLAASSKYWDVVIKSLRENPQRFEGFKWLSGFPRLAPIPVETLPSTWWTTLSTWGNQIFLAGLFENDPEIIGLFTPKEKSRIIEQIITLVDEADSEKFADSLALTISSQSRDFGGKENPFQTFLDLSWQFRSEAKAGSLE